MIRGQVPHQPQERSNSRPLLPAPDYKRSRAALGDNARTAGIAAALERSAAARPYATDTVPGTIVRVLYAQRYGEFPGVRLFYCVGEAAIWLLRIECYDEMEE